MPTVFDPNFIVSSQGDMALMTVEVQATGSVTFADLRANVPPFAGMDDGELTQIAQDVGFEVEGL